MTTSKKPEAEGRDLLETGEGMLNRLERFQIRFVRKSFEPGPLDSAIRACQRVIGSNWIEASVKNIRHVHGFERVPKLAPTDSVICVSNHRSFFDLYLIAGYMVRRGLRQRLVFPVRSNFFYDHPLGMFVNGAMSFFAMYPPVFRERERAAMNLASLDEVSRLLRRGGAFVGLHPEGTRNKGPDPYALLPAQRGVGLIIQQARVPVLPVFVLGLGNDVGRQLVANFSKKGEPIIAVFGEPVDFGAMLDEPPSPKLHRRISAHALEAVAKLGLEEKAIRAKLTA